MLEEIIKDCILTQNDLDAWVNSPKEYIKLANFNVVISSKDNEEFPTYDGYYSTPFSIDVSNI